jgi:putative aminopeptidase FrvX
MKKTEEFSMARIGAPQIKLLESLSNACAVAGDEAKCARLCSNGRPLADEIKVDALGNVLAIRHGKASSACVFAGCPHGRGGS